MKTAWFFVYPDVSACSFMPVYHRLGAAFLEKWLEDSLHWQKKIFTSVSDLKNHSFFVVVQDDDARIAQVRKLFAQKPAVTVKMEFAPPDSFERRAAGIFEKYGSRFDRVLVSNPESPLLSTDDYLKLQKRELDAVKTPLGRSLVLTGKQTPERVKILPGLYDLRSVSDILKELATGRHDFYEEISARLGATLESLSHRQS